MTPLSPRGRRVGKPPRAVSSLGQSGGWLGALRLATVLHLPHNASSLASVMGLGRCHEEGTALGYE